MSDQKKQLNTLNNQNNKESLKISNLSIFKDNTYSIYLYKKTERLVSAIYLITTLISDKEPIYWQLRDSSLNLLSDSLTVSDKNLSNRSSFLRSFISHSLKLLSLLEISYLAKFISEMNFNILKYEFELLIKTVESQESISVEKGLFFPENFFEIFNETNTENDLSLDTNNKFSFSKGHNNMSDRTMSDKQKVVNKVNLVAEHSIRRDIILGLLKKNNELSIKDFSNAIKGCSEKTIQRELATLVSKGHIKKEGEKRWSRYSLK